MYRNRLLMMTATLGFLIVAGCQDSTLSAPKKIAGPAASASTAPSWARTVSGVTGEGAQYAIYVPTNWNGDAVFYAHGIKDVAEPITLPTAAGFPEFRDSLGVMGYAVAYSSFSENGWAVQDGIQKTHQLRGLFNSIAGKPRRAYLAGHSMGGLITVALAETYANQYDGALTMCGVIGGAQKQIDYIANVRTLFDFFYPNVLPGDALDMPVELNVNTQVLGPAQFAIVGNSNGAGALVQILPIPFANGTELVTSILTALAFDARGADDLLDRTHGHSPFDNTAPYTSPTLPAEVMAAVNAGVKRFVETPDAANYLKTYYEPTGSVRIPMMSLHTSRDPVVPVFHESLYASRTNAAGTSANLTQRIISRYGHCTFTGAEMAQAFRDLAGWAETGTKAIP